MVFCFSTLLTKCFLHTELVFVFAAVLHKNINTLSTLCISLFFSFDVYWMFLICQSVYVLWLRMCIMYSTLSNWWTVRNYHNDLAGGKFILKFCFSFQQHITHLKAIQLSYIFMFTQFFWFLHSNGTQL